MKFTGNLLTQINTFCWTYPMEHKLSLIRTLHNNQAELVNIRTEENEKNGQSTQTQTEWYGVCSSKQHAMVRLLC